MKPGTGKAECGSPKARVNGSEYTNLMHVASKSTAGPPRMVTSGGVRYSLDKADITVAARIRIGVRFEMNMLDRALHRKPACREQVVAGRGSPSTRRVKVEERASIQPIFKDYLEVVPKPVRPTPTLVRLRRRSGGS